MCAQTSYATLKLRPAACSGVELKAYNIISYTYTHRVSLEYVTVFVISPEMMEIIELCGFYKKKSGLRATNHSYLN